MLQRNLKPGELNLLKLDDMDGYLKSYDMNADSYKRPFELLAELEQIIATQNDPEECVLINVNGGSVDAIFYLQNIQADDRNRFVTYSYGSIVS